MTQNIENTVKNRIIRHGSGWCFTLNHFADLRSHEAVKKALQRLEREGFIRRLVRGLYERPRHHGELGVLSPDIDRVAKAIAEKYHIQVQPSGAYAANLVGLSEQVPAKIIFATEGVPKRFKIGKLEIVIRRTTPKSMAMAGTHIGLLVHALQHLGQKRITSQMKNIVANELKKVGPSEYKKGIKYSPTWIRELFIQLSKGPL